MAHLLILIIGILGFGALYIPSSFQGSNLSSLTFILLNFFLLPIGYFIIRTLLKIFFDTFQFSATILTRLCIFTNLIGPYKMIFFGKVVVSTLSYSEIVALSLAKSSFKIILYISTWLSWLNSMPSERQERIQRSATFKDETKIRRSIEISVPRKYMNFAVRIIIWQFFDISFSAAMIMIALMYENLGEPGQTFVSVLTDKEIRVSVSILTFDMGVELLILLGIPALMKASNVAWKEIKFLLNTFIYLRSNVWILISFFSYSIFMAFYYLQIAALRGSQDTE